MTNSAAAYVARVGGLAVAIGIGTAVATGQGVALADPSDAGASSSTGSSSTGSSSTGSQSRSSVGESSSGSVADTSSSTGSSSTGSSSPSSDSSGDPRSGIVHGSGGPHTSATSTGDTRATGEVAEDSTPAAVPATGAGEPTQTAPGDPTATVPDKVAKPTVPQPPVAAKGSKATPSNPQRRWKIPTGVSPAGADAQPAAVGAASSPLPDQHTAQQPAATTVSGPSVPQTKSVVSQITPVAATVQMAAPTATTRPVSSVVAYTLAWAGLSPSLTGRPVAPGESPAMLAVLAAWRRQSRQTLVGDKLTNVADLAQTSQTVDPMVIGDLNATGVQGDQQALAETSTTQLSALVSAAAADITPPTVAITSPGGTVSGTVTITATASDNVGVAGVQFLVNGGPLAPEVTSSPYSVSVVTTPANNGTYTVTAQARDAAGNTTTSAPITVTVANGTTPVFTPTTLVSGLSGPTDFRFLPDGRILIAQKTGAIRVANANGQLQSTPLITLPTISTNGRGLLAIEVDPNYATNHYVYAAYTPLDNIQQLSRLTLTETNGVLTAGSETVLVKGTQQAANDHMGGGLSFGPDGKLYWAIGDNVCCSVIDGTNSQLLTNMYGKVLRLNPDGTAPTDNPFYDGAGPNFDGIYATGFRNPFRLTFTPDGKLLVADVGQATWEEVDLVTRGANYGWPNAEGPCSPMGTSSCATPPSSSVIPIYSYLHNATGGNAITAVMVYTGLGSAGGAQHTVLIADSNQGWVKQLTCTSDYSSCGSATMFTGAAPGGTVKLAQGPDGNIYQLTLDGTLSRIVPSTV